VTATTTERLILRRFDEADASSFAELVGDPRVMRFSMSGPLTAGDAERLLRRFIQGYEDRGYGLWAVERRGEGRVLGYCGIADHEIDGRIEHEIAYRLRPPAWGHGYATEAASAVRDLAFGTLRLARVVSIIDPGNGASIRVAEKTGMRYERDVMLKGYAYPDRLYALGRPPEL